MLFEVSAHYIHQIAAWAAVNWWFLDYCFNCQFVLIFSWLLWLLADDANFRTIWMLFFQFIPVLNNYSSSCLHFIWDFCFDGAGTVTVLDRTVFPTVEQITDQFLDVQWWWTCIWLLDNLLFPQTMAPRKGKEKKEEQVISLGPQVAEGENVFGVCHIFASFNDTFVHVTDLSGK